MTVSGTYANNTVGQVGDHTNLRRLGLGWTSQMAGRLTNNVRVSGNVTGDAYEGRARVDTGLFENLNVRVHGGDLCFGFQHSSRLNLSLAYRFLLSSPTSASSLRSSGLNYTLNYRFSSNWQLYSAVTDPGGYFILRDLPAGDLAVTLRAPTPLPADMTPPSGQMKMPFEPTQVDNAVIVIRNGDLAKRLQGQGR